MSSGVDPSILNDFLTETGELIEGLDTDLVRLESASGDESRELLNGIFRALHTVKGAAGFLHLTELTTFAHAAEDALNKLRAGEAEITARTLDVLLKSVDVLREMHETLGEGGVLEQCPREIIEGLHEIGSDADGSGSAPEGGTGQQDSEQPAAGGTIAGERPLALSPAKESLLDMMVVDLSESAALMGKALERARAGERGPAAAQLDELFDGLRKTLEFFELDGAVEMIDLATRHASRLAICIEADAASLLGELGVIWSTLGRLADALGRHAAIDINVATLFHADGTEDGMGDGAALAGSVGASSRGTEGESDTGGATDRRGADGAGGCGPDGVERRTGDRRSAGGAGGSGGAGGEDGHGANAAAQTIRVEVGRLESLMSLVGQLVLTKNRFLALSRRLREVELPSQLNSDTLTAATELDRLTAQLQMGVMRTRMQPLAKLFDRYPRVIRDIARATGKRINLEIVGKETEVDKSVLELLADPLVHMLRNSADHGIESTEARLRAGKSPDGTIVVEAEHRGSHVRVLVRDDGKGIDPRVIGRKAVEKGLVSEEDLATMGDEQIIQLIFAAGFSTAEQITDLSGRGVGMDVVRASVARMGGSVSVSSRVGEGSVVEILIPLTVAIMPAMVVGVVQQFFCVPLQTIVEIVKPEEVGSHSLVGQAVMKLREEVIPLIDLGHALGCTRKPEARRFAVVTDAGGRRVALLVDCLVGQQEIVIRPLDDECVQGGPFSGATIREEGDVSLIVDVNEVVRRWQAGSASATERRAA